VSNKIEVLHAGKWMRARLRPWGDVSDGGPNGERLLYWRSHKWNGHVLPSEEGATWRRGWESAPQEKEPR
jgi:hypothetical protein